MATAILSNAVTQALAEQLGAAWAALGDGAPVPVTPADAPIGPGWAVTYTNSPAAGSLTMWIDRDGAMSATRVILKRDDAPDEAAVLDVLRQVAQRVSQGLASASGSARLDLSAPVIEAAEPPAGAAGFLFTLPGDQPVRCAIAMAPAPVPAIVGSTDSRIDTVLDVDLPLVVRFGRAVMPLRALADLGPGSVIDMARSPDDPVELIVGDRVIARGEVVIVGGNYGVRVTELTAGRRSTDVEVETRLS